MQGRASVASDGRIPALDGLRGLAILGVMINHFSPPYVSGPGHRWIAYAFDNAWIGVDLFFVLSGFLITGILLRTRDEPRYLRNFYARRSLRIFPLAFTTLAVCFLLATFVPSTQPHFGEARDHQLWWWFYASNLLLTLENGWVGGHLAHFWTLAIEEQFYLVWPLVVLLLSRRGLFIACIAMIFLAPPIRWWFSNTGLCPGNHVFTLARIDSLAAGALLALIPLDHLRAPRARAWATLATLFGLSGTLYLAWSLNRPVLFITEFAVPLFTFLAIGFAGLIALSLSSTTLARLLSLAPLRALGTISYGMYILHYPFKPLIDPVAAAVQTLAGDRYLLGGMLRILTAVLLVAALATVSWFALERPFLRLKHYFSASQRSLWRRTAP
jgi:peptidoglycan/LPS O-acetylase OafA/YrhL